MNSYSVVHKALPRRTLRTTAGQFVESRSLSSSSHRRQSSLSAEDFDENDYLQSPRSKNTSSDKKNSISRIPPLYVAATRQHVGKTTTSMALLSGLQKRFSPVGFMKPVGQQCLEVRDDLDGSIIQVDKDAVLVKEYFGLDHLHYRNISPVLIPRGYTRDYLDGKIKFEDQEARVHQAYQEVSESSEIVLCEGTGHCSVGSIVHASNAQVASYLNAKMVLVANGGLGNTFDELQLNKVFCEKEGVEVCGVIVNKVQPSKLEQTREYIEKALDLHWGAEVPLVGCIPDRPFLGCPALHDYENLFNTELSTGRQHRLRHYRLRDLNLVATSLQVFLRELKTNPSRTLYVCHASRNDILLGFLLESPMIAERSNGQKASEAALIVTGIDEHPLSEHVMDIVAGMNDIEEAPPVMLVKESTSHVMERISKHTPKLNYQDSHRASIAVEHYEPHIDFDLLLRRSGHLKALRPESLSSE